MAGGPAVLSSYRLLVTPPRNSNNPTKIPNPHHLPPLLSLSPRARVPHLSSYFNLDCSTSTTLCLRSKWGSQDLWEDPNDGYGSEFDEEDDKDDEEEETNNNASNAKTAAASASEYDELVKEVEMQLNPEERAILQENDTPDFTKISTMKWSPLHTLALSGQIPFMDQLIKYGTDIDSIDKDGFTSLHKAVIGKKEPVISHLLRKGANPHIRDKDGATPLHYAVQVSTMQTVKLLIKFRVDVNVADKDGWTPLHVAVQSRSRDITKVLLINGADKTRKNKVSLDLVLVI